MPSDLSFLRDIGPAGLGIFGGYLMLKEVFNFVKIRKNGNSITNTLLNQKIYETMIEMRAEMKTQTGLLKKMAKEND